MKSAEKEIRMAKSSFLPQFSGRVNYSWYHEDFDKITSMFEEDYNWSATLSLSISLFEGFSRPANVSRAKVGYRSMRINELQYKRDVIMSVKTAFLRIIAARKQIEVTRESLISAEEDLKQSSARYQLGAGTMLEKIDAQVAVTSARVNNIQAEYDYRLAVTGLKKAMGILNK